MTTVVCVIGLGSRGLSVLERITTLAEARHPDRQVQVHVIDPALTGAGLHRPDQPDYLLLNTICGEITMFPEPPTVPADTTAGGPTLFEWVCAHDTMPVRPSPTDHLPRRVLGNYLGWFFARLRADLPPNVELIGHRDEAVDIEPAGDSWRIRLRGGGTVDTSYVFLTTGHTPNTDAPAATARLVRSYPLPQSLAAIAPRSTVAIEGLGLTAFDTLAALTVGRGGRFHSTSSGLRYAASGDEPRITMHSRSGLPYRARPSGGAVGWSHQPTVFTAEAIAALRASRKAGLDLHRDVLPLLYQEMQAAYVGAGGTGLFDPRRTLLDALPQAALHDQASYQSHLRRMIETDLAEAHRGLADSPLKSALELTRHQRDVIRLAVDHDGLVPQSHDEFYQSIVPAIDRAVIGPQAERSAELIALFGAGVVSAPYGPSPQARWSPNGNVWQVTSTRLRHPTSQTADWLCLARAQAPDLAASASPLLRALLARGLARPRPGVTIRPGMDLTNDNHPRTAAGRELSWMWVYGPLAEGATYYNHLVPSPGGWNRAQADAHGGVERMYAS